MLSSLLFLISRTTEQDKYRNVHMVSRTTEHVKGRNVFGV